MKYAIALLLPSRVPQFVLLLYCCAGAVLPLAAQSPPDKPIYLGVQEDSLFVFESGQYFGDKFPDAGQPGSIKIKTLPLHGKLTYLNVPVQAGQLLPYDKIVTPYYPLQYTPDKGFTGYDSLYWSLLTAAGQEYTPPPAAPLILEVAAEGHRSYDAFVTTATTSGKINEVCSNVSFTYLNYYYEIILERSSDGIHFTPVNAAGSGYISHPFSPVCFSFYDYYPLHGRNYYRTKVYGDLNIDLGDTTKYKHGFYYSNTVLKTNNDVFDAYVYPNPVQGSTQFNICVNGTAFPDNTTAYVTLAGVFGNVLWTRPLVLHNTPLNKLEGRGIDRLVVDAATLKSGLYYAVIRTPGKQYTVPFLKLR